MATKASIRQAKYDAANSKRYNVKFNNKTDADIIEKLSSVPNVQAYIRQVIRQDIGSVPDTGSVPVSDSVPVLLSEPVREILEAESKKQGRSIAEIITGVVNLAIFNDYMART